jgi:hypothetical protein
MHANWTLAGMGVGILFVGIQYQKHQEGLRNALLSVLPFPVDSSALSLAYVVHSLPVPSYVRGLTHAGVV